MTGTDPAQMPEAVSAERVDQQLRRILASETFAHAPRSARLLKHLVEHALSGDLRELKEYALGVHVFDRGTEFDPRADSVVRVHAGRLRQRLEQYYASEGRSDPLRIEIPKGRYVASFRPMRPSAPSAPRAPPASARRRQTVLWMGVIVGALLSVGWAALTTIDAGPPGPVTVAVMPFADLSATRDQGYLADGIAEEVQYMLSRLNGVRVIARQSAFALRGADMHTVATRLNARYAVTGSVQTLGERVQVHVQLIEAPSAMQRWAERYDREREEVVFVQAEIAAAVAEALDLALAPVERRMLAARPRDPRAEVLYLQGRFFHQRRGSDDPERARQALEQAVALDPGHARAWAALSGAYDILRWQDPNHPEADLLFARQKEAAERAVALDPYLPEARIRLGNHYRAMGDETTARAQYRQALAAAPDDADALAANQPLPVPGAPDHEGIRLLRRALEVDPLSPLHRNNLAFQLMIAGRLEEAHQEFLDLLELQPFSVHPGEKIPGPLLNLATVLLLRERFDEALTLLESWPPGPTRERLLVMAYHSLGRAEESAALLTRLRTPPDPSEQVLLVEVYSYLGDRDEAFVWLEKYASQVQAQASLQPAERRWMLRRLSLSPLLKPLHTDPRWQRWLQEARILPPAQRPLSSATAAHRRFSSTSNSRWSTLGMPKRGSLGKGSVSPVGS